MRKKKKQCSIPGCKKSPDSSWSLLGAPLTDKAKEAGLKSDQDKSLCSIHASVVAKIADGFQNYGARPYEIVYFHPNLRYKGRTCEVPGCAGTPVRALPKGKTQVIWVCGADYVALRNALLSIMSTTAAAKRLSAWKLNKRCQCGEYNCVICQGCLNCNTCNHKCRRGHDLSVCITRCQKCSKACCMRCKGSFCSNCRLCVKCDIRCEGCGNCSKACACYGEADVALGTWGLPASLNLRAAATRFYVLIEKADIDPLYRPELEKYARELAAVFANYLDMAIGGEIRYGSEHSKEVQGLLPRIAERYSERDASSSRGKAWYEWKELRDDYGTSILQEAEDALFNGDWEGNLGGPMWGECAKTLRMHEEGEYNDVVFVDQAFSLEHNNGCVFNKLWRTSGLQDILSHVFEGEIDEIVKHLPKKERQSYRTWKEYGDHTFR